MGVLAIPVFTDRKKAEFAGRGNVRIIAIRGRKLFSATSGANIVINPNNAWCILYPEEISALLNGKPLGRIPTNIEITDGFDLRPAEEPRADLLEIILQTLAPIEAALDAWITEADDEERVSTSKYVVVVAAESAHQQRIARSLNLALSDIGMSLGKIVDLTFIEPGDKHSAWLENRSDCLIYRRSWLPGLRSGVFGHA